MVIRRQIEVLDNAIGRNTRSNPPVNGRIGRPHERANRARQS